MKTVVTGSTKCIWTFRATWKAALQLQWRTNVLQASKIMAYLSNKNRHKWHLWVKHLVLQLRGHRDGTTAAADNNFVGMLFLLLFIFEGDAAIFFFFAATLFNCCSVLWKFHAPLHHYSGWTIHLICSFMFCLIMLYNISLFLIFILLVYIYSCSSVSPAWFSSV